MAMGQKTMFLLIHRKALQTVSLTIALIFLTGCSSKQFKFELIQENVLENTQVVWPPEPDTARYVYLGDLIGEPNQVSVEAETESVLKSTLYWLIGLYETQEEPLVLQRPQSIVSTHKGSILVTDVSKKAVFQFNEHTGELNVWEYATLGEYFVSPIGIALGAEGQVLVSDSELGRVFILDEKGTPLGEVSHPTLKRPTGIVIDPVHDELFVADTEANDIKVFNNNRVLIRTIGTTGAEPGNFNKPTFLAFQNERLFVSDTLNTRVQVLTRYGQVEQVFGNRTLFVGSFNRPKGIALDSDNNIYVVESYYDHLLIFDQQGRLLLPIGGAGKTAGKFFLPSGVFVDHNNRIFVADMMNGRVSVFQYLGSKL